MKDKKTNHVAHYYGINEWNGRGWERSHPIGTLYHEDQSSMEEMVEMAEEGKEYQPWEANGKQVWEENSCQELPKNQDSLSQTKNWRNI